MSATADHYRVLLDKVLSQTEAAHLEAQTGMELLEQKLTLALFEIEKLPRKLFGRH